MCLWKTRLFVLESIGSVRAHVSAIAYLMELPKFICRQFVMLLLLL